MTAAPQKIPAISTYPDGSGWRVHIDMPDDVSADMDSHAHIDGKGETQHEAVEDAVRKLLNVAAHVLHQVNTLTKVS